MIESAAGQTCFLCNGPFEEKAVTWFDHSYPMDKDKGIKIYLHPKCAVKLATRLIGDAYEADIDVFPTDKVEFWVRCRMKRKELVAKVGDKDNGRKLTAAVLRKRAKTGVNLMFKDDALYRIWHLWP